MKTTRRRTSAKARDAEPTEPRGAVPATAPSRDALPANGISESALPMIGSPADALSVNGLRGSALPVIDPTRDAPPATARRREAPPMNVPSYWGVDMRPEERPGVPRESVPHPLPGTHWREPPLQPAEEGALRPGARDRLTAVFSTALPPVGLAGAVRRAAHMIPDHRVSHWMLLLLADRIDVIESLRPFRKRGH